MHQHCCVCAGNNDAIEVALIWAPPMEAAFDIRILDRPQLHESVLASEAHSREGPQTHSLHECLEVSSKLDSVRVAMLQAATSSVMFKCARYPPAV